jgi:hypothetical protein
MKKGIFRVITNILLFGIPYGIIKYLIIPNSLLNGDRTNKSVTSTEWVSESATLLIDSDGECALYRNDTSLYGSYQWKSPDVLLLDFDNPAFNEKLVKIGNNTLRDESGTIYRME